MKRESVNKAIFKFIVYLLVSAAICVSFLACQKTSPEQTSVIAKDVRGQEFAFEKPISKATSTHSPTLNHLVVIGKGTDKYITGWGRKDISGNLYAKIIPNWDSIESLADNANSVNLEKIVRINPEIIIVSERNWQDKENEYDETGIRTFVCFQQNESLDNVTSSLKTLSELFGEQDRAKEISTRFEEIYLNAYASVQECPDKPRVAFFGSTVYSEAGSKLIQNEMIEKAGGINVASNITDKEKFSRIDAETIVLQNPDYIFIPAYANYSAKDILNDEKLSEVNAVKNKQVYQFPSLLEAWDMPTCSSCLGVCWLANKLHPDCYKYEELKDITIDFYSLLYNQNFSSDEIGI